MKYKVGDKVRVRGDLEVGEEYGNNIFVGEMEKYKGKVVEIEKELCSGYRLGNFGYHWTSEMLRPAEFKIWCETEEELKAVLDEINNEKYFEKHEAEYWHIAPVGIIVEEIKNEHQCVVRQCIYKSCFDGHYDKLIELTPSEFTGIDFSEKIIITKTSTGATAIYGNKTVTAEGDFDDASRQTLAEVLCPFKVGDKVQTTKPEFVGKIEKIDTDMTVLAINDENIDKWIKFKDLEPYTESYNAKLFCIEGHGLFKQGVVYTVENGVFIGVHDSHYKDLEDINKKLCSQFMEVKGGLDD